MTDVVRIGVDCRMINASGIGTCIKGWMPRLVANNPHWNFFLLGDPTELAAFEWALAPNASILKFTPSIYSIHEQLVWLTMRRHKFNLLWIPHMNIPLFWRGKLIVTVHDVIFLAMPEFFGRIKRIYARLFFHRIRQRVDGLSFDTQFTAAEFERLVGKPVGKTEIIYPGVDEKWFSVPEGQKLETAFATVPYIVCVGNVKPHKNLVRLMQAFELIANQVPHHLVIIGKRDGFRTGDPAVMQLASRLGDRVHFTGYVSDWDLPLIVSQASLLVHPSLYEGFGLTPLEAMAAGCPSAISNAGSLPETSGGAAAFFSPIDIEDMASTIANILRDPIARHSLSEKGRQHVIPFNWQNSAIQLSELMTKTTND